MTTSRPPEIYNFHAIRGRLGTAGQPTEAQFRAVREAGFDVVINLALSTSPKNIGIAEAEQDLSAIWQPNGVWSCFISNQLEPTGHRSSLAQ
jgi:hypothetical protein